MTTILMTFSNIEQSNYNGKAQLNNIRNQQQGTKRRAKK